MAKWSDCCVMWSNAYVAEGDAGGDQLNLPERAANLCFAGVTLNRIFICAQQSVYTAWVNVRGAKLI